MSQFIINGGKKLSGEVTVGGAKNFVLKALPAALLCGGRVMVSNVPAIEDVKRMSELMKGLGVTTLQKGGTMILDARTVNTTALDSELSKRLRSSMMLVGPLLARHGEVSFPHPGGCVIGQRPIDFFLDGFQAFGAKVTSNLSGKYPFYKISAKKLRGTEFVFKNISVTGTEAMMMTATLIKGKTILRNAAMEPEIPALADFLNHCGACIKGAGTHTIEIEGVPSLRGGSVTAISDRIDAGSFAILAAASRSNLRINHVVPEHLSSLIHALRSMGVEVRVQKNSVEVRPPKKLKAINLKTHEYPGFPTDLQAPFAVLASTAQGQSLLHETIYEGRLFYIESLNRMGAEITMCDPHRILVNGPRKLYGRDMESPDLRAGLAFVIAALIAKGESIIRDIYSIERGYENIEGRLRAIGADIRKV